MVKWLPTICAGLLACAAGRAADLTFEVASIKPSPPLAMGPVYLLPPRGGPSTDDPGRITWNGATLFQMLVTAYDVKRYQAAVADWLKTERFDVLVKVPAGATKEQVRVMWQNLLRDRFGVVLHHESRQLEAEELVVAKGGPKLKETDLPADTPEFNPNRTAMPKPGPDGLPQLPGPGLIIMPNGPAAHMIGKAQTMAQLAATLGNQLNHPVVDKTGLTGKYDFSVEYRPDGLPGLPSPAGAAGLGPASQDASEPGSNIESAVQDQLGLRLVKGKAPMDVIVVDHAEKTPTEN